jgi:putative NIF3 family GTP cyclohydrolase 1 type 2
LERIGFLTGSGYSAIAEARAAGCQALVTGDIREPTMAEARELGLVVFAAGHEATERFGVMALAAELQSAFAIETRFFPDPNPV